MADTLASHILVAEVDVTHLAVGAIVLSGVPPAGIGGRGGVGGRPCISTGVYRYPKAEACQEAVAAVSDWLASHELPRVVTFCCFGSEDAERYRSRLAGVVPSGRFA